jgi:hypothetical protein
MTEATRSATSEGWAGRPMGARSRHSSWACVQSLVMGVSTRPGAMALTRTSGARAAARSRVTWLSAALLAAYGTDEPLGRTPAWLVMLTTEPPAGDRRSAGRAAVQSTQGAIRLTSSSCRQSAGVAAARSWWGMGQLMPALLTRTSSRP